MRRFLYRTSLLIIPVFIAAFALFTTNIVQPEKVCASVATACNDGTNIPGSIAPPGFPFGWYGCNPSAFNCSTAFAHCDVNPPGAAQMSCMNRCPGGYFNWGQIATCAGCGNPVYDCHTTPQCTPSFPQSCQLDGNGLQTGIDITTNTCTGAQTAACNPGACPNTATTACVGGAYVGYDNACNPVTYGCATISGSVFGDVNKDLKMNGGETPIAGPINVTINDPGATVSITGGSYTFTNVKPGTWTVTFTGPMPAGYQFTPGALPAYQVTVGGSCSVGASPDGICAGSGISNLNFSITNSIPWLQTYNGDVRFDNGHPDPIPQTPVCDKYLSTKNTGDGGQTPGVVYYGDASTTGSFGQGGVSQVPPYGWLAGGGAFHEIFGGGALATEYNLLVAEATKGNVPRMPLSSACVSGSESNCGLKPNATDGVYQSTGDVVMTDSTVLPGHNYIILVNGTLTIKGTIKIQSAPGNPNPTTILFSTKTDIVVDKTVGAAPACPVPDGQIQGFYSADHDFIVDGYNNCVTNTNDELMLNVDGSIIINAARGVGFATPGKLDVRRDLCGSNPNTPAFTVSPRLDLLLKSSPFLTKQQTLSQEEAP